MENNEQEVTERCPHCGASMKKYWHKITPGLVKTLVKVYKAVSAKRENAVSKKDLSLTHSEYGNFQKLRFHGLIAKYKVDGEWHKGDWLITHRGAQFLRGEIEIPEKVLTFRNKVEGHTDETVNIKNVMASEPYFETDFGYEIFEPKQQPLI